MCTFSEKTTCLIFGNALHYKLMFYLSKHVYVHNDYIHMVERFLPGFLNEFLQLGTLTHRVVTWWSRLHYPTKKYLKALKPRNFL